MLPADPSYNYRTEIDILELLGDDPSTMFMTYNYANREQSYAVNKGKFNNGACPVKNYSADFVRMGVDWQPDHIAWFIDGKECARFTNAAEIENGPMQLILHMMVDNDWQRRWNVGPDRPVAGTPARGRLHPGVPAGLRAFRDACGAEPLGISSGSDGGPPPGIRGSLIATVTA
jgi:hypothetical protein